MTQTKNVRMICLLFLASRLVVLFLYTPHFSDFRYLMYYPFELRESMIHQTSFYETFTKEASNHPTDLTMSHIELRTAAYPPLAIWAISLPIFLLPSDPIYEGHSIPAFHLWCQLFRTEMFIFDVMTFGAILWWMYRQPKIRETIPRVLGLYTLLGLLNAEVLYERMDTLCVFLLVLAVILILSQRRIAGYCIFSLAVHYRLIPIVLGPLMVLAPTLLDDRQTFRWNNNPAPYRLLGIKLFQNSGWLILMLILAGLPLYVWSGLEGVRFLSFHSIRPIQIESIYANAWMVAQKFMSERVALEASFGSVNIVPTPMFNQTVAMIANLGLIGAIFGPVLLSVRALGATDTHRDDKMQVVSLAFFTCLCGCILFSKVFSTQYILMLNGLGIIALIQTENTKFTWGIILVTIFSTLVFPWLYMDHLLNIGIVGSTRGYLGPTWLGLFVLTLRNICLAGLTICSFSLLSRAKNA